MGEKNAWLGKLKVRVKRESKKGYVLKRGFRVMKGTYYVINGLFCVMSGMPLRILSVDKSGRTSPFRWEGTTKLTFLSFLTKD